MQPNYLVIFRYTLQFLVLGWFLLGALVFAPPSFSYKDVAKKFMAS